MLHLRSFGLVVVALALLSPACFFGGDDDSGSDGGGGGGHDGGTAMTPSEQCFASIAVTCTRVHECATESDRIEDLDEDGTPDFQEFFGSSVEECELIFDQGKTVDMGGTTFDVGGTDCASVTAENACDDDPTRPIYSGTAAAECRHAYEQMSCAEWSDPDALPPAACNEVCSA